MEVIKTTENEDNKRYCFDCDEEIDKNTIDTFPDTELCIECIEDEDVDKI